MTSSPKTVLLDKLRGNDPYTTWLTLSHNHVGMDICSLVDALASNDKVFKVSCHAPFMAHLSISNLTRLLKACANLPNLQELWVALPANRAHLSSSVADAVLNGTSSSMHKLTLRGVDPDGCLAVSRTLNNSSGSHSLKELNLYGTNSSDACLEMMKLLLGNSTLQQLILPACDFNNACAKALAEALKVNTTLVKLDLVGGSTSTTATTAKNTDGCREILNVLTRCENDSLSWFNIDTTPELQASFSFYTHLNRTGLSSLLHRPEVTLADCVRVLSQNGNNDLSIIYHVLSEAPHLLTVAFGEAAIDRSSSPGPEHRASLRPTRQPVKAKLLIEPPEPMHAQRRASLRATPLGSRLRTPSPPTTPASSPPVPSGTISAKSTGRLCFSESAFIKPLPTPSTPSSTAAAFPRTLRKPESTVDRCSVEKAFIKFETTPPTRHLGLPSPSCPTKKMCSRPMATVKPVPSTHLVQSRRASDSAVLPPATLLDVERTCLEQAPADRGTHLGWQPMTQSPPAPVAPTTGTQSGIIRIVAFSKRLQPASTSSTHQSSRASCAVAFTRSNDGKRRSLPSLRSAKALWKKPIFSNRRLSSVVGAQLG